MRAYSPKCVEGGFSELRCGGVLGSSHYPGPTNGNVALRLSKPPDVLATVRPDRGDEERHTVAGEPERGRQQRLGVGSDGAPGELRVAVCGQVRGYLLDDLGEPSERHEQPGGEGDRQID